LSGDYQYRGAVTQAKRDNDARAEFMKRAGNDLAGSGWGSLLTGAGGLPKGAVTPPSETQRGANQGADSPVARARVLLDELESRSDAEAPAAVPDRQQIESAAAALRDYLGTHPEDVGALIVSARIGLLTGTSTPQIYTQGQPPPDPEAEYKPLQELLDRALKLEPNNAEANYWKARLYGVIVPDITDGTVRYRSIDLEQAIQFARRASDLAPRDIHYKEALALYLVLNQQPADAMTVLKGDRTHPIYRLLEDWQTWPLPENAVLDRTASEALAQIQQANGTFKDYSALRVHSYVIPMSAAQVEAFFRNRWQKFALGEGMVEKNEQGSQFASYQLYLRQTNAGWEVQPLPPSRPTEGTMIVLMEVRNPVAEIRNKLPIPVGDVFCNLAVVNFHSVAP
jgi:tetratricopeptide (TPR) repeat protein